MNNTYPVKEQLNILLMGATGVGKSSLINAIFGKQIVKTGVGKPITQHLEKIEVKDKGLTLWDTKGIEAQAYSETMADIKKVIRESFESLKNEKAIDIAYLCIKESSGRIEDRDLELLKMVQQFGIPTVVVFTDVLDKNNSFVEEAKRVIDQKFKTFINGRYIRVNSVHYKIHKDIEMPMIGIEELCNITYSLLIEASYNKAKQFYKLQILSKNREIKLLRESQHKTPQESNAFLKGAVLGGLYILARSLLR